MRTIRLLSALLLTLLLIEASAKKQPIYATQKSATGTRIAKDSTVKVWDDLYLPVNRISDYSMTYLKARAILQVKEDTSACMPDTFSCTVKVRLIGYHAGGIIDSTDTVLSISYDKRQNQEYTAKDFYEVDGVHYLTVKVLSVSNNSVRQYIELNAEIEEERYKKITETDLTTVSSVISSIDTSTAGWIVISFTPVEWAEEYDLEWTFVDGYSETNSLKSTSQVPFDFRWNTSRVTLQTLSYSLSRSTEKGYLLCRVRAVTKGGDQFNQRLEGVWSTSVDNGYVSGLPTSHYISIPIEHQPSLNWQYSASYADEGRISESIAYLDGTSRVRQTVGKINSDSVVIVQESIYDHAGRAVVQTLPVPTSPNRLQYFTAFNKNASGVAYSRLDVDVDNGTCTQPAPAMSTTSGSSKYYSAQNSWMTANNPGVVPNKHDFIPVASGFPFTQVEYTRDNTGRIAKQTSPGPNHQIGTGHEIQYFYGIPMQEELDRLFGSEVGVSSHYKKNMVRDANGQLSVSFLNSEGKVIATALAGDAPDSTEALPSNATRSNLSIDLMGASDSIYRDDAVITTRTFLVTDEADYRLYYSINAEQYDPGCASPSFCTDCVYDLSISLTNQCGQEQLAGDKESPSTLQLISRKIGANGNVFDTVCTTVPNYSFKMDTLVQKAGSDTFITVHLTPGEYTVTKTLSVNQEAVDYYTEQYISHNTCKTLKDFQEEEWNKMDTLACAPATCETCLAKLGSQSEFLATRMGEIIGMGFVGTASDTIAVKQEYSDRNKECTRLCDTVTSVCEVYYRLLKADVTPGGQYAWYDTSDFSTTPHPESVLNDAPDMSGTYSYKNLNESPWYDSYFQNGGDLINGVYKHYADMSTEEIMMVWKDSFADHLVVLHPEYCHINWCKQIAASDSFDKVLYSTNSYDTAVARGYLNPLNKAGTVIDPFFADGGQGYLKYDDDKLIYQRMKENFDNYASIGVVTFSMWDIPKVLYHCPGETDSVELLNCARRVDTFGFVCAPFKEYYWQTVRTLYLSRKAVVVDSLKQVSSCSSISIPSGKKRRIPSANNPVPGYDLTALIQTNIDTAHAQFDRGCDQQCNSYADYWMDKLKNCSLTELQLEELRNRLVRVCKYGCDGKNGFGSSSINPVFYADSLDSSFHDVLVKMGIFVPGICDDILIAAPGPYKANDDKVRGGITEEWAKCGCVETNIPARAGYTSPDIDYCSIVFNVTPGSPAITFPETGDSSYVPHDSTSAKYFPCSNCETNLATVAGAVNFQKIQERIDEKPQGVVEVCSTCMQECADCEKMYNAMYALKQTYHDSVLTVESRPVIITRFLNNRFGFSGLDYSDYLGAMLLCLDSNTESNYFLNRRIADDSIIAHYMDWGYELYIQNMIPMCDTTSYKLYLANGDTVCPNCGTCNGPLVNEIGAIAGYTNPLRGSYMDADGNLIHVDTSDFSTARKQNPSLVWGEPSTAKISCHILRGLIADFDALWSANTANDHKTAMDRDLALERYLNNLYGVQWSLTNWLKITEHCREKGAEGSGITGTGAGCCVLKLNKCMADSLSTFLQTSFSDQNTYASNWSDFTYTPLYNSLFFNKYGDNHSEDTSCHFIGKWTKQSISGPGGSILSYYDFTYINTCVEDTQHVRISNPMIGGITKIDSLGDIYRAAGDCYPLTNNMLFKIKGYYTRYDDKLGRNVVDSAIFDGYVTSAPIAKSIPLNCTVKICDKIREEVVVDDCKSKLRRISDYNAMQRYLDFTDSLRNAFIDGYKKKCLSLHGRETFVMNYTDRQYHYTLYYYDQAGNLTKTVPPAGVRPLSGDTVAWVNTRRLIEISGGASQLPLYPAHQLVTCYKYNTLNQLVGQTSPDAGTSSFFYDAVGRLVLSSNAKQIQTSKYSYTVYDNLNRISEVGELTSTISMTAAKLSSYTYYLSQLNVVLNGTAKSQITHTYYDEEYGNATGYDQLNLRNRVAKVTLSTYGGTTYEYATYYSYDETGNVTRLVREDISLAGVGQDIKTVDYEFDIISGKVQTVYYQKDEADQYVHRYAYDRDNRITGVYTATHNGLMDLNSSRGRDAVYSYYLHGPLARTLLSDMGVQGVDYAYTLQGWLKGVNSETLSPERDMGKDGLTSLSGNTNRTVAPDVYGFTLHYYANDYSSVASFTTSELFVSDKSTGTIASAIYGMYNGNISAMVTSISKFMEGGAKPLASVYRYDQLNRILAANYYNNIDSAANNWSSGSVLPQWKNTFSYDANGNILTQVRRSDGSTGIGFAMDSLEYKYYAGTNKLRRVIDRSGVDAAFDYDVDHQTDTSNYRYDAIGNLIHDKAEEIDTIEWTVYGKIKRIKRIAGSIKPDLEYGYSPDGYRVMKLVIPKNDNQLNSYTYYMRDAQGNILATYERTFAKTIDYDSLWYKDVNDSILSLSNTAVFASVLNNAAGSATLVDHLLSLYQYDTTGLRAFVRSLGATSLAGTEPYLSGVVARLFDVQLLAPTLFTYYGTPGYVQPEALVPVECNPYYELPADVDVKLVKYWLKNRHARETLLTALEEKDPYYVYYILNHIGITYSYPVATGPEFDLLEEYLNMNPGSVTYEDTYEEFKTGFIGAGLYVDNNAALSYSFSDVLKLNEDANMALAGMRTPGYQQKLRLKSLVEYSGDTTLLQWLVDPACGNAREYLLGALYHMQTSYGVDAINYLGGSYADESYNAISYFQSTMSSGVSNEQMISAFDYVGVLTSNESLVNFLTEFYVNYPDAFNSAVQSFPHYHEVMTSSSYNQDIDLMGCVVEGKYSTPYLDMASSANADTVWSILFSLNSPLHYFEQYQVINPAVIIEYTLNHHKQWISDYQQSHNLYSTSGNGVKAYFNTFKTALGAEFHNNLTRKFYNVSRAYTDSINIAEYSLYGSSRLGSAVVNKNMVSVMMYADIVDGAVVNRVDRSWYETPSSGTGHFGLIRGRKHYELSNHLGNVLVLISDKKVPVCSGSTVVSTRAEVLQANDYSPFGAPMPGRSYIAQLAGSYLLADSFNTNTSGWSATSSSIQWVSGRLKVTPSANTGRTYKNVTTTVPGRYYIYHVTVDVGTLTNGVRLYVKNGSTELSTLTALTNGVYNLRFKATSTTTGLYAEAPYKNTGSYFYVDNIQIEEDTKQNSYLYGFNGQMKDNDIYTRSEKLILYQNETNWDTTAWKVDFWTTGAKLAVAVEDGKLKLSGTQRYSQRGYTIKTVPGRVYRTRFRLSDGTAMVEASIFSPNTGKHPFVLTNTTRFVNERELQFTADDTISVLYIGRGWASTQTTAVQTVYVDYVWVTEKADQINSIGCREISEQLLALASTGASLSDTTGVKNYLNSAFMRSHTYAEYAQMFGQCNVDSNTFVGSVKGVEWTEPTGFTFNGQERNDEISVGLYTAEYWEYDARLGRRWNVDPITNPSESPYATFANNPIYFIDPDGLTPKGPEPPEGKEVAPLRTALKNFFGRIGTSIENIFVRGRVWTDEPVYRKKRERFDILEVVFDHIEEISAGSMDYTYRRRRWTLTDQTLTLPDNPFPDNIPIAKTQVRIMTNANVELIINGKDQEIWQDASDPFKYNAIIVLDEYTYEQAKIKGGYREGPGDNPNGGKIYFTGQVRVMSEKVLVKVPRGFLGIRNWKKAVVVNSSTHKDKPKGRIKHKRW